MQSNDDRRPFAALDGGAGPEPEDEWTYENSWRVGLGFAILLILCGVSIIALALKG